MERLKERKCELCGAMGDLVMHHIRNINQLKADTKWNVVMITINNLHPVSQSIGNDLETSELL